MAGYKLLLSHHELRTSLLLAVAHIRKLNLGCKDDVVELLERQLREAREVALAEVRELDPTR